MEDNCDAEHSSGSRVPALAATALLAANEPEMAPRSLVLIGGPVDPLANPTRLVERLRPHSLKWFRKNIIEAVPPRAVQIDPQHETPAFAGRCLRTFLIISWSDLSNACRAGDHRILQS